MLTGPDNGADRWPADREALAPDAVTRLSYRVFYAAAVARSVRSQEGR